MPTYRYRCAKCGDELDERQSFSDSPLTTHEECGGTLARVFSTPGIVLKGSGFYRTDSRNGSSSRSSGRSEKPASGEQSAPSSESGNEGTGSDGAKSTPDTKDAAPSGSKTSS